MKDEEKAVAQSVGSSSSSLNAQNAVRMLRQSLKNMSTPQILKLANITVILMSVIVFVLTISQFVVLNNDFNALTDLYDIVSRVSMYAISTAHFYYQYIDFYLVNKGYHNPVYYDAVWWTTNNAELKADLLSFVDF